MVFLELSMMIEGMVYEVCDGEYLCIPRNVINLVMNIFILLTRYLGVINFMCRHSNHLSTVLLTWMY